MTGTPLLLTEAIRRRLRDLAALAAARPVDMPTVVEMVKTEAGKREHMDSMNEQTMLVPMGFMVTFSIEQGHPCGTCRHMSMSVTRSNRVPNREAVWMVAQELDFWGTPSDATLYAENLLGHGVAINVVQPIDKPRMH